MDSRKTRQGERSRVPLEQPVSIRFKSFSEFMDEMSANISTGGMFIRTRNPPPVALVFEFELRLGDAFPLISGKAQVAWVRSRAQGEDQPVGMGARFVELDGESLAVIEQLVDNHQREAEPGRGGEEELGSSAASKAVIEEHLKTLKLPAVARQYAARASQAREGGWDYEEYLRELLEAEVSTRRERTAARRLRAAQFPEHKTLAEIDWQALEGVAKPQLIQLARCDFIGQAEDIVIAGPIGTGKTHLAIALGVEATQLRYRVLFRRAADLARELLEARDERELGLLQSRLQRVDLLICDEVGFAPFDKAGGEILFHVLAERCGRRSTILTTNLAFGEWPRIFGSEELAMALVDRLEQAHVLTPSGPSYRGRGAQGSSS